VLRIVGQNRDRSALGRLNREHGQGGIDWTGGRDGIRVDMTRMHVGSNASIAERVVEHPVRAADPAAAECVLVIVDRSPAESGGCKIRSRPRDCLGNSPWQERDIGRVGRASQGPHGRWRRISVGCRDQHAVRGNPRLFMGHLLGTVEQLPGHHAAIDNDDRQMRRAIVEHQAFREQRVVDLGRTVLEKSPVDQDREGPGRHVNRMSPGAKSMPVGRTRLVGRDSLRK
jgi:hypothetical protein